MEQPISKNVLMFYLLPDRLDYAPKKNLLLVVLALTIMAVIPKVYNPFQNFPQLLLSLIFYSLSKEKSEYFNSKFTISILLTLLRMIHMVLYLFLPVICIQLQINAHLSVHTESEHGWSSDTQTLISCAKATLCNPLTFLKNGKSTFQTFEMGNEKHLRSTQKPWKQFSRTVGFAFSLLVGYRRSRYFSKKSVIL